MNTRGAPAKVPEGALRGIRVLDLSQDVAGAYCARLLAGLGADVLKVEPPGGDITRRIGADRKGDEGLEGSSLFLFLNQGKRSITLDLYRATDRLTLEALLRDADVLVAGLAPGIASELKLTYPEVSALNPSIVFTSVSTFGYDGPYCGWQGAEVVAAALGGLMHLTGEPDKEPLHPGGYHASYLTGMAATAGTLMALYYRQRTKRGQWVEVSTIEVLASSLEGALAVASSTGLIRNRQGNRRRLDYPVLLLPCRDGHVVVTIANDADWDAFTYLVGDARLREGRFASAERREMHGADLEAILTEWLSGIDRASFFAAAREWRFPCCPVVTTDELLDDEQHAARDFFVKIDHPEAGPLRYPSGPFRMPATPWVAGRAPLLGEHNETAAWLISGTSKCVSKADNVADRGSNHRALAGLRVLDLSSMWAGPLCTRLLGDAGAEVIKIELATRPDGTRQSTGAPPGAASAFFEELNRNKFGVTLDLRTAADRKRFERLVASSDAILENFSPRVMRNLGLTYPVLRAIKQDVIMVSMPAFGIGGPWQHAVAFGSGLEASSGLASLTGYLDGPPALLGVAFGDPVAGLSATVGLLAALLHRDRTGEGQHIEVAQREALTQCLGEVVVGQAMGRRSPPRRGNAGDGTAFSGCYRCTGDDRWVVVAVDGEKQWRALCAVVGKADLAEEHHGGGLERDASWRALDEAIREWAAGFDHREAMCLLQQVGVSAGAVLDSGELLVDPHFAARRFFAQYGMAGHLYPGALYRLSASPLSVQRPAPGLGEHNLQFLA